QDKSLWEQQRRGRGNYCLVAATEGNEVSKCLLESGIAYWHTTDAANKWYHILELYNQLVLIEYSPGTALSRAFAFSKVFGNERAIGEVEKLKLDNNHHYHALLGRLYEKMDSEKAVAHFERAIALTTSRSEERLLERKIGELTSR